jgi:hypothetical protein
MIAAGAFACTRVDAPVSPVAPTAPVAVAPAAPPVLAPAPAQTIEIRRAPATVGERWEVSTDMEATVEMRIDGLGVARPTSPTPPQQPPTGPQQPPVQPAPPSLEAMRFSVTEHRLVVLETLAVEGANASEGKVEFVAQRKQQQMAGANAAPEPTPPIWGKSYRVANKGGELDVRTPEGKPAPAAEVSAAREALQRFGEPDPLVAAIPARALAVGDTVEIPGDAITRMLGPTAGAGFEIPVVGLQLRAIEGAGAAAQARFAVTAPARSREQAVTLRIDLTGELLVRVADGRPLALSIAGPISFSMRENAGMKAEGSGRVFMATRWIERAGQGPTRSNHGR